LQVKAVLTGLESLKIKETDRVQALINELAKLGTEISEIKDNTLEIRPDTPLKNDIIIKTYKDHRMAMAFAPLAIILDNIIIEDPDVVSKSYPDFWDDLKYLGFKIEEIIL
jgi:3-phosphoshikimate 1-carboxyvinyltransferase